MTTNKDQLDWLGGVETAGNLTTIAAVQVGTPDGTAEMTAADALKVLKEMSEEELARAVYPESAPEADGAAESDTPQPSAEAEVSPEDERESVTITPKDVGTIDAAELVGGSEKTEEG